MLAIILGLAMSLAHRFSYELVERVKKHHNKLLSFSAGISVTYLFLELLPYFSEGAASVDRRLFFFILLGFVMIHLAEKYIYFHFYKDKLRRELALENAAVSFIYHFLVGMLLVGFARSEPLEALLFFVPVFLHTAFNAVPVIISKSLVVRGILSSSTFLGVVFSMFVYPEMSVFVKFALIGFVTGIFIYMVLRHAVPLGRAGSPFFLVLGFLFYIAFDILMRLFF